MYDLGDCHMGTDDMSRTNAATRLLHAHSIIIQSHSLLHMHVMMCKVDILVVRLWLFRTVCKASPQGSPVYLTLRLVFDQCQKAQ